MAELTDAKRGEIALKILKDKAKEEGFTLKKDSTRNLKNVAQRLEIDFDELKEFTKEIVLGLFNDTFN